MAATVADFLLQRLHEWGVKRVFGYPGDGINGFIGALAAPDKIRLRPGRGTRRWRPSWPAATPSSPAKSASAWPPPGPGAIHLLNGLYDAKLDHQPVRRHRRPAGARRARRALPAGDRPAVAVQGRRRRVRAAGQRPGAGAPSDRPRHAHRAAERTRDLHHLPERPAGLAGRAEMPPHEHGTVHSGIGCAAPQHAARRGRPAHGGRRAERGQARWRSWSAPARCMRRDELIEVAERLGAGVAKALLGKAARAGRAAVCHRFHRPARHQAQLGHDERTATPC